MIFETAGGASVVVAGAAVVITGCAVVPFTDGEVALPRSVLNINCYQIIQVYTYISFS